MNKAVIVYASRHHGNTRKIIERIAGCYPVRLIDADIEADVDLSAFDTIGFASGIDFGDFYKPVIEVLKCSRLENMKVFFLYTAARPDDRFVKNICRTAMEKGANIVGIYGCKGFNTYGAWKLIGGMNKSHPTEDEVYAAVRFYAGLMKTE